MPNKNYRKTGISTNKQHDGLPTCSSFGANLGGRCTGCCLLGEAAAGAANPQWQRLLSDIAYIEVPKGAGLYTQGVPGTQLYSLRTGLVKLVQHLPNGTERIVRLLRGGDIAGLEILRKPAYRHTAIALEPVKACQIHKDSMLALDRLSPHLHWELMDRWERGLEAADWWIAQLSTGPVDARLARLIQFLKQADGEDLDGLVKLPNREDMASMLGVATETLCRAMVEFQRTGALRRVNNRLYRLDRGAIERLALG